MNHVVILGGTKGLGAALAQQCLDQGHTVTVIGSSVTDGVDGLLHTKRCDLTNKVDVLALCDWLAPQSIDTFFWCAGAITKGPFASLVREDIARINEVSYAYSVLVAHAAWQSMHATSTPKSFVVVASSSGLKARKEEQVYCGVKWAQVGFTRSLALENENTNLTIMLVTPGGMQTPFWKEQPPGYETFNDPQKVAAKILATLATPGEQYRELDIPRGAV